jgi:hypothetical protein
MAWNEHNTEDSNALYNSLPGICRATRQLFLESTPFYLASQRIHSLNTCTSKLFIDFLSQFPKEDGFKAITDAYVWDWTEAGTSVQLDLITHLTNVEHLDVTFGFDGIHDGEPEEEYIYNHERYTWMDTGLHYTPPESRTVEEEIARMRQDTQDFVEKYNLERVLALPKLDSIKISFADSSKSKCYRHRLCHPVWEWAEEFMVRKWGKREEPGTYVYTDFEEDFENVGMS